jgi:hypothetical protein
VGGKDWEDEVLKWQLLFGNEWVRRVDLDDKGVYGGKIPVGLYEREAWKERYRLKPLEEREVIIAAWERQNTIKERIQNEQSGKSKTR